DHARGSRQACGQLSGIVDRAEVVGDQAAVRARRHVAQLRGRDGGQRRVDAEGQELKRYRRRERLDELVGRGDDDEALRGGGDDLLARVRGAAALDQPAVGRDLVGAVDGDVEPGQALEGDDVQAELARPL